MISNSKYDSSDSDSDSDVSSNSGENNNKLSYNNNDLIPMEEIDDDNYYFENNEPDDTWDEEDIKQYNLWKISKQEEYETLKGHTTLNFEKDSEEKVSKKKVRERTTKTKETMDLSQFYKSDDEEEDTKGQPKWRSRSMEERRESLGLPTKSKKSKCPYKFQFRLPKWSKDVSDSRSGLGNESVFEMEDSCFPSLN